MGLVITELPQDILFSIFLHLTVEAILSLKQTCRVLHAIGSADYLWHRSVADFDLPLDLPGSAVVASLSGNELRDAVVKAMRLDRKWRDAHVYPQKASCIISRSDAFVDALQLLPGGKWLITFQVDQCSRTTIVSLWSLHDVSHAAIAFQTKLRGRIRSHHAFHDRIREEITIAVGSRNDNYDSIRIYKILTRSAEGPPFLMPSHIVLETQPRELVNFGLLREIKICGDIVTVLFARFPDHGVEGEMRILCFNTFTRNRVVITGLDLLHCASFYVLLPRHFGFVGPDTCPELVLYDIPISILDSSDVEDIFCRVEPRFTCHLIQYVGSVAGLVLSDGPTDSSLPPFSFALAGFPDFTRASKTQMLMLRVTSHDTNSAPSFSPTYASYKLSFVNHQVQVGSSGCRAVWIEKGLDVEGNCLLKKFSTARTSCGQVIPATTSTLMPAFSGLPFNPQDCQCLVFDEVSCRLCTSLPSGQVFTLDY